jgi:Icc-related predicted phosphoesterase
MKILITTDLHGCEDWYAWLLKEAGKYDVVVVSGDLLTMDFAMQPQVGRLLQWGLKLKALGTPLFVCDGNHDENQAALPFVFDSNRSLSEGEEQFYRRAYLSEHWMDGLLEVGATIVAGMTQKVPLKEDLIVTSLMYDSLNSRQNLALLEEGRRLRKACPRSPWLVLSHEPPGGRLGGRGAGSEEIRGWIEEFQPTFVFSGHDHAAPFRNDTCCELIGISRVFNPGHRANQKRPCHVVLDLETGIYIWNK